MALFRQPKLVNPFDEGITSPLTTGLGRSSEDGLRQNLVGAWCPSITDTGNNIIPDISGYRNNGILTNMNVAASWVASGTGISLDFDGTDDYVDCGKVPLNANNFCISIWLNVRSSSNVRRLFAYYGDGPTFYRTSGGNWAIVHSGTIDWDTGILLTNNVWQHIAFVRRGANAYFYINGALRASNNAFNATFTADTTVRIGGSSSYGEYTSQQADDIRLYTRSLTSDEVFQLYEGGRGYGLRAKKQRLIESTSVPPPTSPTYSSAAKIVTRHKLISPMYEAVRGPVNVGYSDTALANSLRNGLVRLWSPAVNKKGVKVNPFYDEIGNNALSFTNMDPLDYWVKANVNGKMVSAVNFAASNNNYAVPTSLSLGTTHTTYAWVLCRGQNTGTFQAGITGRSDVADDMSSLFIQGSGSGQAQTFGYMLSGGDSGSSVAFTTPLLKNRWALIATVRDGVNILLYLNGQRVGSGSIFSNTAFNLSIIGTTGSFTTWYFNGQLGEIGFYNRTISDGEAKALYHLGPGWYSSKMARPTIFPALSNLVKKSIVYRDRR